MIIRYFTIAIILITPVAHSKCAYESHDVSGKLFLDNQPFVEANVKVRALDSAKNLIEGSGVVDKNGFFSVTLKYNTYSGQGISTSDKCDFLLTEAVILVFANDFKTFSEKLLLSTESTTYNKAFNLMGAANRSAH